MEPKKIIDDIYQIGGPDMTDSRDCSIYLVDTGELVLIDAGAGASCEDLIANIQYLGLEPQKITSIILTHCHIDHIGGASFFRDRFGAKTIMHSLDADAAIRGDRIMTAASWYGVPFPPLPVDIRIEGEAEHLVIGGNTVTCLHTPGHTPGSMSVFIDIHGKRVLFGQDIHGPFLKEFGANLKDWTKSMNTLLSLKADILCEGHFGIYSPGPKVAEYIERYLDDYGED